MTLFSLQSCIHDRGQGLKIAITTPSEFFNMSKKLHGFLTVQLFGHGLKIEDFCTNCDDNLQSTICDVRSAGCNLQYAISNLQSTIRIESAVYRLYTIYNLPSPIYDLETTATDTIQDLQSMVTVYTLQSTISNRPFIYTLQLTIYSLQSEVCSLQSEIRNLQSTIYSLQSAVYGSQFL